MRTDPTLITRGSKGSAITGPENDKNLTGLATAIKQSTSGAGNPFSVTADGTRAATAPMPGDYAEAGRTFEVRNGDALGFSDDTGPVALDTFQQGKDDGGGGVHQLALVPGFAPRYRFGTRGGGWTPWLVLAVIGDFLQSVVLNWVYRPGRVITLYGYQTPADHFGVTFGKWRRLGQGTASGQGAFLLGWTPGGPAVRATGGVASVTLAQANLPPIPLDVRLDLYQANANAPGGALWEGVKATNAGGSAQPFSVVPPFETVCYWVRVKDDNSEPDMGTLPGSAPGAANSTATSGGSTTSSGGGGSPPAALALAAAPASASTSADTTGGGQALSSSITFTPSGGAAPYTLSVARLSGDSAIAANPASTSGLYGAQAVAFSSSAAANTTVARSATFRATVTDANGATATQDVNVQHSYTYTASSSGGSSTPPGKGTVQP